MKLFPKWKNYYYSSCQILLFSCSSEEESPSDPVVGNWYYYGVTEVTIAVYQNKIFPFFCYS